MLISLRDYQLRFADVEADEKRKVLFARMGKLKFRLPKGVSSSLELRDMVRAERMERFGRLAGKS